MGKRGPKPVDLGMLSMWEFEFWKAFHFLRDGVELPGPQWARSELARLSPQERDALHIAIQRFTLKDYAALMAAEDRKAFEALDHMVQEWSFEQWKNDALAELAGLKPKLIPYRQEGRELWNALIRTRTRFALKKTCLRWKELAKVRFPAYDYILNNAEQLFAMKRAPRFPSSSYADDSRIDYLARGMAGVLEKVSPQTAIERLRNMKHAPGGPLWKKEPGGREYCGCWRCNIKRGRKFVEALGYVDLLQKGRRKR